jgi:hypothetical protein
MNIYISFSFPFDYFSAFEGKYALTEGKKGSVYAFTIFLVRVRLKGVCPFFLSLEHFEK